MTVYIAQCLCGPARHAILGCAYEGDAGAAKVEGWLRERVKHALAKPVINPHCALCGARVEGWTYEVTPSRFTTLEAATPELKALEAAQVALAAELKARGRAYDSHIPPTRN
jgi:hypothetical protein